jgi:hypothetical protein
MDEKVRHRADNAARIVSARATRKIDETNSPISPDTSLKAISVPSGDQDAPVTDVPAGPSRLDSVPSRFMMTISPVASK